MQGNARFAALVVALFLALPIASAEWRGRGYYEPDTEEDRTGGYMNLDPDTNPDPADRKAYLSVWANLDRQSYNPNSAIVGSSMMPYPTRMFALLGVWKDCNADGYIGMPEGVAQAYPTELLDVNLGICPETPVAYGEPDAQAVHNDGAWVREFFPIGPQGGRTNDYIFDVNDETARIWGDWGLPDEGPIATCPVTPLPRGTWQSTGGFLRYVDCHPNWRVTGAINTVADVTGLQMVSFADAQKERPDQSGSVLNQENPWGQESDESYVTAFDCSREPIDAKDPSGRQTQVTVGDPVGIDEAVGEPVWSDVAGDDGEIVVNVSDRNGRIINLTWQPGSPSVNPNGSPGGTVNETGEGVYHGRVWSSSMGSCDRNDDTGGTYSGDIYPALQEADHEGQNGARSRTDFYFSYSQSNATSRGCSDGTTPETCTPPVYALTGEGGQIGGAATWVGVWFGNPSYTASRNPFVNRETAEPWGASYVTFYATVERTDWTPGAIGTYGSEHCNGAQPTTGLWECDGDKWWLDPYGNQVKSSWEVLPGQTYNLMDVDCYDHDATNLDDSPGPLTLVGERQCRR